MGMGDQPQLQKETPPRRRWGVPRAAAKLLSLFFRHRDAIQPKPDPLPTPVEASKPEGEEEATTLPSRPETDVTKKNEVVRQPDPGSPDLHEKTAGGRRWRVLSSVMKVLLSFFRHRGGVRAPEEKEKPETEDYSEQESEEGINGEETKQQEQKEGKKPQEEKEPPGWPDWDKRLEEVLEREGTKDIGRYYNNLPNVLKYCLLCFSIFKPHSKIKKKTMIYWWIGQKLAYPKKEVACPEKEKTAEEVAEGYFGELVKLGFIEPMRNNCTGAIHDCRIHPFVHWMIKNEARTYRLCSLDERGNPSPPSPNRPEFLCMCLMEGSPNKEQASGPANVENPTPEKNSANVENPTPEKKEQASSSSNVENSTPDQKEQANKTQSTLVLFNLDKQKCSLDTDFLSQLGMQDLSQFEMLVVLQLGRWFSDAKHHIEVEDFESLSTIGHLKKLRYLSLLGLSRLTILPADIKELSNLLILDLRDCQNLVRVGSQVTKLEKLTHLDLTECYMLENIAKGIGQLSELQVFKGFVFGESKRRKRCSLWELSKLKKLRKLSINITSEAKIDDGEMNSLKDFQSLRSLTITWGRIPQFFENKKKSKKKKLKRSWTGFELPKNLDKFDIRCFPDQTMPNWFKGATQLTKLYIRGGKLQTLAPQQGSSNGGPLNQDGEPQATVPQQGSGNGKPLNETIKILRLKYLKSFDMQWEAVKTLLPMLDHLEVIKCNKVADKGFPPLDDNGVWIKDEHASFDSASTVKVPPTSPAPNVTEVTTTTTSPDATTAPSSAADVTPTAKPDPSPAAASPGPSPPENTTSTLKSDAGPLAPPAALAPTTEGGKDATPRLESDLTPAASPGPSPPEDTTSTLKSDAGPLAPPAALVPTTEGGKDATPMPESDLTPAATPAPSSPKAVEDNMLPPKSDASPLASAPAPGPTANDATHTTESGGLSPAAATPAASLGLKADDTAPSTETSNAAPLNAA